MVSHEGLVSIQSTWNGWRAAEARLAGLRDVHWHQPAGAPCPLLHAYIDCSDVVLGGIPHECDPASAPHRLLVCVLKSHTVPRIYAQLAARASGNVPGSMPVPASTPAPALVP